MWQDLAEFEERLGELAALLPELSSKLAKMKVDLVCALLQDTQAFHPSATPNPRTTHPPAP